jgi:HSP20 family molecular chaperone IbpA
MLRRIFMDLNRLERELDYIANAPRLALAARSAANKTRQPMADIRETETKVIAAFELPGVARKTFSLISQTKK